MGEEEEAGKSGEGQDSDGSVCFVGEWRGGRGSTDGGVSGWMNTCRVEGQSTQKRGDVS